MEVICREKRKRQKISIRKKSVVSFDSGLRLKVVRLNIRINQVAKKRQNFFQKFENFQNLRKII